MGHWLRDSGSHAMLGYRLVIDVPTVEDEARLRRALKKEFDNSTVGKIDLDKPLRILGFDIEFKWPSDPDGRARGHDMRESTGLIGRCPLCGSGGIEHLATETDGLVGGASCSNPQCILHIDYQDETNRHVRLVQWPRAYDQTD
jgi:hypothetical protein